MKDCIFCKIAKKEIPSDIVFENKNLMAILDIMPVNPGHTLVITKKHYKTMIDVPDKLLSEMILVSKKVGKAVMKGLKVKGFNLGVNNGTVAGQKIDHVHFHIITRLAKDGLKLWPQRQGYRATEAEKIIKKIKKVL
ncbi:MAG: HIT family protein [Patescibacteria group bacterium]|nr:HIT family protein [Patescibacteria group bacterium]